MKRPRWIVLGTALVVSALLGVESGRSDSTGRPAAGGISQEGLARVLASNGLKPIRSGTRYDFGYRVSKNGEDWELAISCVLSHDQRSIWVMAWLDELPKTSADIPRAALLQLLVQNDRLGNGKFFAYDRDNRRFLLQRVIPNQFVTSTVMAVVLRDLAESVVETRRYWSAVEWKRPAVVARPGVPPAPPARSSPREAARTGVRAR